MLNINSKKNQSLIARMNMMKNLGKRSQKKSNLRNSIKSKEEQIRVTCKIQRSSKRW